VEGDVLKSETSPDKVVAMITGDPLFGAGPGSGEAQA
jgi:hypothetical protein